MTAAKENLDTGTIITIGVLLVVLTFVLILLVQGWFYKAERDEYVRKVIEPRAEELGTVRAEQQALLTSYSVVDAKAGTVSIPIERAMELVVRQGL
ncbi:MAG: hypothetical protein R3D98_00335 [Candidatus Krumholzibacteriia bacterium]